MVAVRKSGSDDRPQSRVGTLRHSLLSVRHFPVCVMTNWDILFLFACALLLTGLVIWAFINSWIGYCRRTIMAQDTTELESYLALKTDGNAPT
jgi:hypothetical protein